MSIDRDGEGPPLRKAAGQPDDPSALRATPFTEDVFDDEYYRGRGRSSGGSPLGLIFGVVVGAVVAGSAAWFVLKDNNISSTTNADGVPVVKAETSPYKIKPEKPGGMQVENQDKTVYDRVAKTDAPSRVENLLPAPEVPKTPPKIEPKPEPKPEPKVAEAPKSETPPAAAAPVEAKREPKSPLQEKADDLAIMIAALEDKNQAQEKSTAEAKAALADPAKPADVKLTEPTAPATAMPQVAAVPPSGGGFQVQLAAAKTEEAAMAEWERIKKRHPELLSTMTPSVMRADLGERGVFFRLRAGFLPDKAAADTLCAAITAQGDACLVVKP